MAIVRTGYANFASFPVTGAIDIIYVDLSNGNEYIWNSTIYTTHLPTKVIIEEGYKDSTWFNANPTFLLGKGQKVNLEQTGTYKLGDGVTELQNLSFLGGGSANPDLQEVTDSGNATTNDVEAQSFITTGGTSTDFVKGDGSLDSTQYTPIGSGTVNLDPVIDRLNTSPISPITGDRYLINTSPTGSWVGFANNIAEWDGAAWVFTPPVTDYIVDVTNLGTTFRYNGSAWVSWPGTAILQNGNSLGIPVEFGSKDNQFVYIRQNNVRRFVITPTHAQFSLGVRSTTLVANRVITCDANKELQSSSVTTTTLGFLDATSSIQTQLNSKIPLTQKGAANGVATLDGSGLVPASQLPSYVDDILEFANLASFPVTGEQGKIYVALDTDYLYRWTGSVYIQVSNLSQSLAQTLVIGNSTGSNDIIVTNGDLIKSENTKNRLSVDDGQALLNHVDTGIDIGVGVSSIEAFMYCDDGEIKTTSTKNLLTHDVSNELNSPKTYAQSGSGYEIYADDNTVYITTDQQSNRHITIDVNQNQFKHDAKNVLDAPVTNFPQMTASKDLALDGSNNLVTRTDTKEYYTVTGTTQALTQTPLFIYGIYQNGLLLEDGVDYTISGLTITFTLSLSSDRIQVVYKY